MGRQPVCCSFSFFFLITIQLKTATILPRAFQPLFTSSFTFECCSMNIHKPNHADA